MTRSQIGHLEALTREVEYCSGWDSKTISKKILSDSVSLREEMSSNVKVY